MLFLLKCLIILLLPVLSGYLYRLGGSDQNPKVPFKQGLFRSFIGIPIGLIYSVMLFSWIPLICILTFIQQPPYGEKSYLNFLGEKGKFFVCGLVFGISSIPVWIAANMWWMGLIQSLISGTAFLVIKILDDADKVKNPWVERLRGYFGTILL